MKGRKCPKCGKPMKIVEPHVWGCSCSFTATSDYIVGYWDGYNIKPIDMAKEIDSFMRMRLPQNDGTVEAEERVCKGCEKHCYCISMGFKAKDCEFIAEGEKICFLCQFKKGCGVSDNVKTCKLFQQGEIKMKIGDTVKVLPGASEWMREHGYWLEDYPPSIDNIIVDIVSDYTNLNGNDSHFICDLSKTFGIAEEHEVGIHPQWLEKI